MVAALGNVPGESDRVVLDLMELLDDPVVVGYAVIAVGRLGAIEAIPKLQELIVHSEKWVRDETGKALKILKG